MVALWSLAVLAVFAVTIGENARSKITFVSKISERSKLRYIAASGVETAIVVINEREGDTSAAPVDFLAEAWSYNPTSFENIKTGAGSFTVGSAPFYGVMDEERKININTATREVIRALASSAAHLEKKEADELAAAITDWRDTDDFPLLNGAESRYYESLSFPYKCKSAAFETVGELRLVRGMTEKIYDALDPHITVYGTGRVNINTATPMVLSSLGVNKSLVNKIMSFRRGADNEECTYDDNVFTQPSAIAAALSQATGLSPSEVAVLANLSSGGVLDVCSSVFTIKSAGKIGNKPARLEVTCVYDASKAKSGEKAIKFWQERFYAENSGTGGN